MAPWCVSIGKQLAVNCLDAADLAAKWYLQQVTFIGCALLSRLIYIPTLKKVVTPTTSKLSSQKRYKTKRLRPPTPKGDYASDVRGRTFMISGFYLGHESARRFLFADHECRTVCHVERLLSLRSQP